jgi:hypothetical protein
MPQSYAYVVRGLRKKYGRVLGQLSVAPVDRVRIMGDLAALARVIRLFDPECDVAAIAPMQTRKPLSGRNGPQWTRMALDVLRQAGRPLTAREIARRVTVQLGTKDIRTLYSIESSLHKTLERRAADGDLKMETAPKRWSAA